MHIVIIGVAFFGYMWYRAVKRGKLTIKACCFITALSDGLTIEQANMQALTLHPLVAAQLKEPTQFIVVLDTEVNRL